MNKIIREWRDCCKIKIFEFRVIDRRDNSEDWVTFDIDIVEGSFVAQHEPLNKEQRDSEFVAAVRVAIDPDFSLDENLVELYNACVDALSNSEFYSMTEEN
jgi:hypothetical protein